MKKVLLVTVLGLMAAGCSTVQFETPEGYKATYTGIFRDYDKVQAVVGQAKFKAEKAVVSEKTPDLSTAIEAVKK